MHVLTIERIAQSLKRLRGLGIHRNIIMYLCIKRASAQQETTEGIKIDFREFFERFLTIRNAPLDRLNKPYIIPFESSDAKIWLNRNLAGSFAPSSVRPDNPVNTAIAWDGAGSKVTYALRPNHGKAVFENLLRNGQKISALDLAIFLYRDFGFDSDEMSAEALVSIFKNEFGYIKNGETTSDYGEVFDLSIIDMPGKLFVLFSEN